MENALLQEILEKIDCIDGKINVLIRQKMSNKEERLMDEVKRRSRLDVKQTINFLGVSRTHALTLMERISKQPGFKFRKGAKERQMPSTVQYDASQIITEQRQRILALLQQSDEVTYRALMDLFGVDLQQVKLLARDFVETHCEFTIINENKVGRKDLSTGNTYG